MNEETVEHAMPETFNSLEDAMKALSATPNPEAVEESEDTTEQHQPEDVEDETVEEEAGEEADEEEELLDDDSEESDDADGDDVEEDTSTINYEPNVRVTLEDGTESTLEDLVKGNLRQSDYTRKTEALAEERRELEETKTTMSARNEEIQRTYNGLVEFLQGIMPPEPSLELLGRDQAEYLRQQAIRKSFTEELSVVLNKQGEAQTQANQLVEADIDAVRKAEAKKLVDAMPMLSDEMRMANFREGVVKTAQDFGFSEQEINGVVDHRLLQLVHLAGIGKRSIENAKSAKKRIERKAQTPVEKKPAAKPPRKVSGNGKAMRKLSQSGSIEDAMLVDFQ